MADLQARLDKLEEEIKRPQFRENKGLGNEIGYYVFDYPAQQELEVRERIEYIKNKNERGADDYKVVVFDLYDIIIEILQEKGFFEKCVQFEKTKGFERITKAVGNTLKITDEKNCLINLYIKEHTPNNAIIFITGVGKSFPILRSHKILNSLHQVLDEVPVIMFFPGDYTGQELILFSEIKDDNYYRAFKLVD